MYIKKADKTEGGPVLCPLMTDGIELSLPARTASHLITYIALGITLGFAAGIQPGPFQTFLISRTLQDGWRHSLPAAFAPLMSDAPAIALALLLLTSLPAWMENALHFAGGFFVLFLAYGAYRAYRNYTLDQTALLPSRRQNFFKAVGLNLLNPNPYLFWSLVSGPMLLRGWREAPVNGVAFGVSFYAAMVATCAAIILLFAGIGKLFPTVNRILIGVSVVALALFGLYQLWLGASALWG